MPCRPWKAFTTKPTKWGEYAEKLAALKVDWRKPPLLGFACPEGVWVGSGVSWVQEPFVATPATMYGNHDDRGLRLDRLLAGSSFHRFRYPR